MSKARDIANLIGSKYLLDGADPLSISGNQVQLNRGDATSDSVFISEGDSSRHLYEFVGTASQTVFGGPDKNGTTVGYVPKELNVYVNGVRVSEGDYVATDGLNITLNTGVSVNDVVEIESFAATGFVPQPLVRSNFVATASQTVFTASYIVGRFWITVNGVILTPSDYVAVNGTSFTLNEACSAGDNVSLLYIGTVEPDSYLKTETYNKAEVYNKTETYSNTEVYSKAELSADALYLGETQPTTDSSTKPASTEFVHNVVQVFHGTVEEDSSSYRMLTEADSGKTIYFSSSDPVKVLLPKSATSSIAAGFYVDIVQRGTGQVWLTTEAGDTLENPNGYSDVSGQYGKIRIQKLIDSTDSAWVVDGALAESDFVAFSLFTPPEDHILSTTPITNNATATYTRAGEATIEDWEGTQHIVPDGELRWMGARRTENLLTYSEDLSNADWYADGNHTVTSQDLIVITGVGTYNANRLRQAINVGERAGRTFTISVILPPAEQFSDPDAGCQLYETSGSTLSSTAVKPISGQYSRIEYTSPVVATGAVLSVIVYFDRAVTISERLKVQCEEVTNQYIKTAADYVATESTPVTKWFDTAQDGTPLRPIGTQSGVSMYDTYASWKASEVLALGQRRKIDVNGKGMYIECSTAGTTGGTEPDWYNEVQPELVTNGTFDSDTGWTKGFGWTISGGKAIHAGAGGDIYIAITCEVGVSYSYQATVDATGDSSIANTAVQIRDAANTLSIVQVLSAGITPSGITNLSQVFVATETTHIVRVYSADNITIDNISVRPIFVATTITDNTATWDIAPTNYYTYRGPLIEEARTNLLSYSSEFDNAAWIKQNTTVTATALKSPIAGQVVYSAVPTGVGINSVYRVMPFTNSGVISVIAKANGYSKFKIGTSTFYAIFDLGLGTIYSEVGATAEIQNLGDGWYRCVVVRASSFSATIGFEQYTDAYTRVSTDADGVSGMLFAHAQLESNVLAASSPIITTTAAVTRNADALSYDTANWFADGKAGTMQVDADYLNTPENYKSISRLWLTLGNSANNRMLIYNRSGNDSVGVIYRTLSTTRYQDSITDISGTVVPLRASVSFGGGLSFASSGQLKTTATDFPLLDSANKLYIGTDQVGGAVLDGCLLNFIYYQKRLANSVIEANSAREYSND